MSTTKITDLPSDLIIFINSFLDYKSFLNLESCCKQFWKIAIYDGRNSSSVTLQQDFQMLFYASKCENVLLNIVKKTVFCNDFFLVPANLKHFVKANFINIFKHFLDKIVDGANVDEVYVHVLHYYHLHPCSAKFLTLLLDRGVKNPSLDSILIASIFGKRCDCTELFLKIGADPNRDLNGDVPLFIAAEQGLEYVKLLCDYGANLNILGPNGDNVLAVARHMDTFEYLISKGVDIHNVTQDGCSLLHLAARSKDIERFKKLLELGVDPNLRDISSRTAQEMLNDFSTRVIIIPH